MSDAFHCPYCDDPNPHQHPIPVSGVMFARDLEGLASLTNGDVERIAARVCDMLDERRMAACPIHGNEGCPCASGAECEVATSDGSPLMRFRRGAIARRASGYRRRDAERLFPPPVDAPGAGAGSSIIADPENR